MVGAKSMRYYIDSNKNIHEKTGMDHRIEKGLHTGEGLTEVSQSYVDKVNSPSESDTAKVEYVWAYNEISGIDEQINKCLDKSSRAISTETEWRKYRELLRDYATVSNGVYSLRTKKPVAPK